MREFLSRTVVILSLSILALFAGATAHSVVQGSPARVASYSAAARVIRLARLGNVRAQAQLGSMYARGVGVPQNYVEAAKWYYRAADRGDGRAQLELGLMYNKGQGVPRDLVLSHMWAILHADDAGALWPLFRTRNLARVVACGDQFSLQRLKIAEALVPSAGGRTKVASFCQDSLFD